MAKRKTASVMQNKFFLFLCGFFVILGIFLYRTQIYQFVGQQLSPSIESPSFSDTYVGLLPCADCSGTETTLIFKKNTPNETSGNFTLKQIYVGKSVSPLVQNGMWSTVIGNSTHPYATIFQLKTDGQDLLYFLQLDTTHIKMLDTSGNEIDSALNFTLTKQP